MLILESKSPCSFSYDEEQLYFLGVEFNDDWTVRSGPIRKLKWKMFTGILPLAHLCNIIGLCYNDFIDCVMILNNLIIMMMMTMTLKESCGGGHLDVVLMFMKTWLRLNTGKLSDSPQLASSSQPPSRHHIITITITSTSQSTSHIYHTYIIRVGDT